MIESSYRLTLGPFYWMEIYQTVVDCVDLDAVVDSVEPAAVALLGYLLSCVEVVEPVHPRKGRRLLKTAF